MQNEDTQLVVSGLDFYALATACFGGQEVFSDEVVITAGDALNLIEEAIDWVGTNTEGALQRALTCRLSYRSVC